MTYKVYDIQSRILGEFESYQNALSYYIGNPDATLISDSTFMLSKVSLENLRSIFHDKVKVDINEAYNNGYDAGMEEYKRKCKEAIDIAYDNLIEQLDDLE